MFEKAPSPQAASRVTRRARESERTGERASEKQAPIGRSRQVAAYRLDWLALITRYTAAHYAANACGCDASNSPLVHVFWRRRALADGEE